MNFEFIVLIAGTLVTFTGVLFKTTKESADKNSVIKWPNHVGWLVLVLMITSFFITLHLKEKAKDDERVASEKRLNKEIRDSANFENKRTKDSTAQVTNLANAKSLLAKSDSITFLTQKLSNKQITLIGQQLEHTRELMLVGKYIRLGGVFVLRLKTSQEESFPREYDEEYKQAKINALIKGDSIYYGRYLYAKQRERLFPAFKHLGESGADLQINYGQFWESSFNFFTNGKITSGNYYHPAKVLPYRDSEAENTFNVWDDELKFEINFNQNDTVHAALLYKLIKANSLKIKMTARVNEPTDKPQTLSNWEQHISEAYFLVRLTDRNDMVARIPLRIQSTSANTSKKEAEIIWVQSGKPQL